MMNKNIPEISVIIIFLNTNKYLSLAIESVLAQTFQNWELLLIDDGSSDGSTEIAKNFSATHPDTIKYYDHDEHINLGMSASRNLGISKANGSFIAFLDSDDLWPPDKLRQQQTILKNHPEIDIVFGKINFFYENETPTKGNLRPLEFPSNEIINSEQIYRQLFLNSKGMLTTFGRLLVRKEALINVNGFENQFRGLGEDVVAWGKLALLSKSIAINDCALFYRRHENASGYKDKDTLIIILGMIRIISFLINYVSNKPVKIQEWALPILHESLFKFYVKKAWIYPQTRSRVLHFVGRRKQLFQMLFWLSHQTKLLTPWRILQIIILIFAGQKGSSIVGL